MLVYLDIVLVRFEGEGNNDKSLWSQQEEFCKSLVQHRIRALKNSHCEI